MRIPADAYIDENWLSREISRWFSDQLFTDLSQRLKPETPWNAFQLADKQLVIRRTASGLRCHDNVCLHRSAQIFPHGRGSAPMRCGYHGWQYDDNGVVCFTPLADRGCLVRDKLAAHTTWEQAGLVWTSLNSKQASCNEQPSMLGAYPVEESVLFHQGTLEHKANWKLLVENVVEGYHLSFVHPQSFVPAGYSSTAPVDYQFSVSGSEAFTKPHNNPERSAARLFNSDMLGYRHIYVFPNLFMSLTNGLVLFVSYFHPTSSRETRLEYALLATPTLMKNRPAVISHVQTRAVEFTEKVLREDLALLEASQRGLTATRQTHQLQPVEQRVIHFHERYMEKMAC